MKAWNKKYILEQRGVTVLPTDNLNSMLQQTGSILPEEELAAANAASEHWRRRTVEVIRQKQVLEDELLLLKTQILDDQRED